MLAIHEAAYELSAAEGRENIFSRKEYRNIIADSLNYGISQKG